jgi:hypothetical protein
MVHAKSLRRKRIDERLPKLTLLIAYRFTALAEYDENLRSLINAHGTGPGPTIPRLNNISLDADTLSTQRSEVASLLRLGLDATNKFLEGTAR